MLSSGRPYFAWPPTDLEAAVTDKRNSELPVLELNNLGLRIEVRSKHLLDIARPFQRSTTGGQFSKTSSGIAIDALKDISCKIYHGERVALIGHNGAGKSTFLRLVSGIYQPTYGSFISRCKVYPMLQKGFITSPELSGLEAIKAHYLLLNGNLKDFDSYLYGVVEFSGIGDYVHLPLKGYSDGMKARLMFAMITGSPQECLALDEGFGTGDNRFYRKARMRMQEFVDQTGTLLLASHSPDLLRRFCSRGLVFDQGSIVYDAPLVEALDYYNEVYS